MKRPIPPPCRIVREGMWHGLCDICGSSLKRGWFGLGKVIGCLQPKCWNWHGWSFLPAGTNRSIHLYGAPEKPKFDEFGLPTPKRYPPMPAVKPPKAERPLRVGDCVEWTTEGVIESWVTSEIATVRRQDGYCFQIRYDLLRHRPSVAVPESDHVHEWHTADGERYECACGATR